MRIIVPANRANASRPGMPQFSLDDIRTLTHAPARKTMLSESSEADRASMTNMNSKQKKEDWPELGAEKNLRNSFASRPCSRPCRADLRACVFKPRRASGPCYEVGVQTRCSGDAMPEYAALHFSPRNHDRTSIMLLAASFETGSLHRPDRRDEDRLRTRQNSQCQRQRRQGPYCYAHQKRPTKACLGIQCRRHYQMADNDNR